MSDLSTDAPTAAELGAPAPKAQPVRNVQAAVAAASAVVTALGGVSLLSGQDWVAWLIMVWGLFMVGYNTYQAQTLPQKVVPLQDTAAYIDADGNAVAGPASPLNNGTKVTTVASDDYTF